jgi:hypothetical protein
MDLDERTAIRSIVLGDGREVLAEDIKHLEVAWGCVVEGGKHETRVDVWIWLGE